MKHDLEIILYIFICIDISGKIFVLNRHSEFRQLMQFLNFYKKSVNVTFH